MGGGDHTLHDTSTPRVLHMHMRQAHLDSFGSDPNPKVKFGLCPAHVHLPFNASPTSPSPPPFPLESRKTLVSLLPLSQTSQPWMRRERERGFRPTEPSPVQPRRRVKVCAYFFPLLGSFLPLYVFLFAASTLGFALKFVLGCAIVVEFLGGVIDLGFRMFSHDAFYCPAPTFDLILVCD